MKRMKPHVYKLGRETVHRHQLQAPGGHWLLEMKVYYSHGTPALATMEWLESHPGEWHVIYNWDSTNPYLISNIVGEGKPFLQFVRTFLMENQGAVKEAVSAYAGIITKSLHAIDVR